MSALSLFESVSSRGLVKLAALRAFTRIDDRSYCALLQRLTGKSPGDPLTDDEAGLVINQLLAIVRAPRRRQGAA